MQARDEWAKHLVALEAIDRDLARVLARRVEHVEAMAALRAAAKEAFLQWPGEASVQATFATEAPGFPADAREALVRELIHGCHARVGGLRIAMVTSDSLLARKAARELYGSAFEILSCPDAESVLLQVQRGEASLGAVLLETTHDGASAATLFALANAPTRIQREQTVIESYHLMAPGPREVTRVLGTPRALAACHRSLSQLAPQATRVASTDVEPSALSPHDGMLVAEAIPGWTMLHANVEDTAHAQSRFAFVGKESARRTGLDRTFLALSLGEGPGSLYAALQPFAERGINLTRLESRTAPGSAFDRLFFVELDGHASDRAVLTALDEVRAKSRNLRVLGSVPRTESRD